MNKINCSISLTDEDGILIDYFSEINDLYSKLSGVKSKFVEDIEFIEIEDDIQFKSQVLRVVNINLKFENIYSQTKRKDKTANSTPKDLIFVVVIIVKKKLKNKTFANNSYKQYLGLGLKQMVQDTFAKFTI